jgi:hypothetical protein
LARMFTPSTMRARASPPKMTSFAAMCNSPKSSIEVALRHDFLPAAGPVALDLALPGQPR